jgi:hypothetical protein
MCACTVFCLEWQILWPPRILTLPCGTLCILYCLVLSLNSPLVSTEHKFVLWLCALYFDDDLSKIEFWWLRTGYDTAVCSKLGLCLAPKSEHKIIPVLDYEPCNEDIWRSGDVAPYILNLTTRCRWWWASCPSHLTIKERIPGTHWIGGWILWEKNFLHKLAIDP